MIKHKLTHAWMPIVVISFICAIDWFIKGHWPMDFWLGFCGGALLLADDKHPNFLSTTHCMKVTLGQWLDAHLRAESYKHDADQSQPAIPVRPEIVRNAHLAYLRHLEAEDLSTSNKTIHGPYREYIENKSADLAG